MSEQKCHSGFTDLDLITEYPGRDPWLYIVETDEDWDDEDIVTLGRRPSTRMRVGRLSGALACWKTDHEYCEAFTEKICSDLACILGIQIPSGVIARTSSGEPAFLSKAPARKIKPMALVRGDIACDPGDVKRLRMFAGCYQPQTVAFDLWVDNWDKHPGNLILNRETREITSIDYGWVFGLGHNRPPRWVGVGYMEPLFPFQGATRRLPLPEFVDAANIDREPAIRAAETIAQLPDNLIEYIVRRAAGAYTSNLVDIFADEVIAGLSYRRRKIMEWMEQGLPKQPTP